MSNSFKREDGTWSRTIDRKDTAEYVAYHNAKSRCTNPKNINFSGYGGRGIKFLFGSFDEFMETLGPRPDNMQLDRINNAGHYEPENVRWATPSVSTKNRACRSKAGSFNIRETSNGCSILIQLSFSVPTSYTVDTIRKFVLNLPEREAIQQKIDKEFYGEVD